MFLGTTLAVLYLFLIFTVASITFRKGHFVLGFLGIILPFLWHGSCASGQERRYDERDRTYDAQHVTSHTGIV